MRLNQPRWWPSARQTPVEDRSRTPNTWWRVAVPTVCLLAGLLLATTHTVSGGGQIRGSEAPRLVDLVRGMISASDETIVDDARRMRLIGLALSHARSLPPK